MGRIATQAATIKQIEERLRQLPPEKLDAVLDFISYLAARRLAGEAFQTMKEYMANGAQLGWLLDPRHRRVYVYRPGAPEERLDNPATLRGDPLLPGFVLDVQRVFDATF